MTWEYPKKHQHYGTMYIIKTQDAPNITMQKNQIFEIWHGSWSIPWILELVTWLSGAGHW